MDVTCYGVLMFYIEISVFPGNSECRLPLHWGYGIHKNNINIKIKDQTFGFKEFQLLRQSFKETVIYILSSSLTRTVWTKNPAAMVLRHPTPWVLSPTTVKEQGYSPLPLSLSPLLTFSLPL